MTQNEITEVYERYGYIPKNMDGVFVYEYKRFKNNISLLFLNF